MRVITGYMPPSEGQVVVAGYDVFTNPIEAKRRIGYLPEERGLYKKMKVGEQLKFFAELKGVTGKKADHEVDQWLARMKLSEWKNKKSMELSKGMQQKIQFISTVLHDPDLLILDEPTAALGVAQTAQVLLWGDNHISNPSRTPAATAAAREAGPRSPASRRSQSR